MEGSFLHNNMTVSIGKFHWSLTRDSYTILAILVLSDDTVSLAWVMLTSCWEGYCVDVRICLLGGSSSGSEPLCNLFMGEISQVKCVGCSSSEKRGSEKFRPGDVWGLKSLVLSWINNQIMILHKCKSITYRVWRSFCT